MTDTYFAAACEVKIKRKLMIQGLVKQVNEIELNKKQDYY